MSLDDIPAGSLCVIDTNVLLYAEQGISDQAQGLLRRCSKGDLVGALPQIVWQELTHKLMLAEAMMKRGTSGDNLAGVSRPVQPNLARTFTLYQMKVRALVELGLRFEPCEQADLLQSGFDLQQRYGLLTNDAVTLAVAVRLKADCLVASDLRFRFVEEIDVLAPSDLRIRESSLIASTDNQDGTPCVPNGTHRAPEWGTGEVLRVSRTLGLHQASLLCEAPTAEQPVAGEIRNRPHRDGALRSRNGNVHRRRA